MAGYYSNYYNEFIMAELKDRDLLVTLRSVYWSYFFLFFVLLGSGLLAQFYILKKDMEEEEENKKEGKAS